VESGCSQPAGNLLATCWQPAGNLLAICRQICERVATTDTTQLSNTSLAKGNPVASAHRNSSHGLPSQQHQSQKCTYCLIFTSNNGKASFTVVLKVIYLLCTQLVAFDITAEFYYSLYRRVEGPVPHTEETPKDPTWWTEGLRLLSLSPPLPTHPRPQPTSSPSYLSLCLLRGGLHHKSPCLVLSFSKSLE
jgi:hypothetical protein